MAACDVIVVGAGLAGATLALALAQGGLEVALVDREVPGAAIVDGRASFVAYAPWRMWRTLGVAERIAQSQAISGIVVGEGATGAAPRLPAPAWIGFAPEAVEAGEPLGWMVENAHARAALAAALADSTVQLIAPEGVEGFTAGPDGATVQLASGGQRRAAVLVGADGARSGVRRAAGIGVTGRDYRQTGLVATVAHTRPHGGVARQVFLPSGPLAALPLTGDRSSLVWSETLDRAAALKTMPAEAFCALLARRFGDELGAFTLITERWTHPLSLQVAERRTAGRVALVGDAAIAIHPLAGQGLNLGLKDAAALAETLVDAARLGEDLGSAAVLDRYARLRGFDAAAFAVGTDALKAIYAAPLGPFRGAGVALANGSGVVRRLLTREAGGAAGEPPRLLRGAAL